jgi:hypothetical protein
MWSCGGGGEAGDLNGSNGGAGAGASQSAHGGGAGQSASGGSAAQSVASGAGQSAGAGGGAGQSAAGDTGQAGSGPAGSAPAGSAPAGSAPAGSTDPVAGGGQAAGSVPVAGGAQAVGSTPAAGSAPAGGGAVAGGAPAATQPAATQPAATQPAATQPAATQPAAAGATIVPLYTAPSDPSWSAIIAAKAAHPRVGVVAVVNPASGPGGAADPGYASGIARLNAAGIKVLGYVATGYATKTAETVQADIGRWKAFYPGQIGGIFFDEQSDRAGDVPFYKGLSQYAKSQGLAFTVGNPGKDTAESYIGALDTMLIYESAGLPSATQMGGWHAAYAPSNFGVIPYGVTMDAAFVHNARQYVQYVYLQNDSLPNPWDSLPTTFADLLAALE